MNHSLEAYFYNNPIFGFQQLRQAFPEYKNRDSAFKALVHYHLRQKHIQRVKQSLYVTIPRGGISANIDPFLLASHLTSDAIIAYQSALDSYGYLHSARFEIVYLTHRNIAESTLSFENHIYKRTKSPKILLTKKAENFEVNTTNRFGSNIRITSAERAFVDVLDRPGLFGYDWEEIAQSLRKVHIARPSALVAYLELLEAPITASRVGYFIERQADKYGISEDTIARIQKLSTRIPTCLDRNITQGNVLVQKWNLKVPKYIHESRWEEFYGYI